MGLAKGLSLSFVAIAFAAAALSSPAAAPSTHLVLVGGGPTPAPVFERALKLSGGRRAVVAVMPQTYPNDGIADAAVTMWKTLGAAEAVKVSRSDEAAAQSTLARATLIWIPGGFQGLFMRSLEQTRLPAVIRARFDAGVTVGGASAGAAAVCDTMIADESSPDGVDTQGAPTVAGLGLWPEAIVSPHFTERRRLHALESILAGHPSLLGVGLDEGTAVVVSGGELEVLGRGTAVLVDGGRLRTLQPGMRFRYRRSR